MSSSNQAHGPGKAESEIKRILALKDYYKILNIDRDSSDIVIKKAYKKLALLLHPDKCNAERCEEAVSWLHIYLLCY